MRVERELMRGAGPFAVLKLLKRREMYGYELVEARVLAMGQSTLYPMLYNLEAKGYISSRWRQAESGRQRKYYALTRQGRQRLAFESRQWQALVNAIASLGVVAEPRSPEPLAEAPS
jgi:PadR family transcriptional regulator PadR